MILLSGSYLGDVGLYPDTHILFQRYLIYVMRIAPYRVLTVTYFFRITVSVSCRLHHTDSFDCSVQGK